MIQFLFIYFIFRIENGISKIKNFNISTQIQLDCLLNTSTNILEQKLLNDMNLVFVSIQSYHKEALGNMRKFLNSNPDQNISKIFI